MSGCPACHGRCPECKPACHPGPQTASCPLVNKNQSWTEAVNLLDFAEPPHPGNSGGVQCFLISRTGAPGEVHGAEGVGKGRPSVCVDGWERDGHQLRTASPPPPAPLLPPPTPPLPHSLAGPGLPSLLAVYRHKGLCILGAGDSSSRKSFLYCVPDFPERG